MKLKIKDAKKADREQSKKNVSNERNSNIKGPQRLTSMISN